AERRADLAARGRAMSDQVERVMRGLLAAIKAQSDKIERFKRTADPLDAIHAKFDADTGAPVAEDDLWGHLQIDAIGLFLLAFAQMTAGGLRIARDSEDAAVLQNLIWYVADAATTADYGVWERGEKTNHGRVEINSSSIGMAKAGLEAMAALGPEAAPGLAAGFIVPPDDVARMHVALDARLPEESPSKDTDAALFSVIGFPGYAVADPELCQRTRAALDARLAGACGYKRFLRDGHQSPQEDTGRLHYEPGELAHFQDRECEWPLFLAYAGIEAGRCGELQAVQRYAADLKRLSIRAGEYDLIPELYIPNGSEARPNDNIPLLWAQSLALIVKAMAAGALEPGDWDPLGRRHPRIPGGAVRLVIVAADAEASEALDARGIAADRLTRDVETRLAAPLALRAAWARYGAAEALGLTGRPLDPIGPHARARIHQDADGRRAFVAALRPGSRDRPWRADALAADLLELQKRWTGDEAPVAIWVLSGRDLADARGRAVLDLIARVVAGESGAVALIPLAAVLDGPTWPGAAVQTGFAICAPAPLTGQARLRRMASSLDEAAADLIARGYRIDLGDGGYVEARIVHGGVAERIEARHGENAEAVALMLEAAAQLARGPEDPFVGALTIRPAAWSALAYPVSAPTVLTDLRRYAEATPGLDAADDDRETDWRAWRRRFGALIRLGPAFAGAIWDSLEGVTVVDGPDGAWRLDGRVLRADHTRHERGFARLLEHHIWCDPIPERRSVLCQALLGIGAWCGGSVDLARWIDRAGGSALYDLSVAAVAERLSEATNRIKTESRA
ncbi:MAG: glycoside hydrolase family 15 protein, partial [Maricaulaceae bacterium]